MAEYIEREALIKELSNSVEPFNTGSVFRTIRKQPAVNVAPVVHGRWICYPDCGVTRCSHCGWSIEECWESKRCPECGAKMDGAE